MPGSRAFVAALGSSLLTIGVDGEIHDKRQLPEGARAHGLRVAPVDGGHLLLAADNGPDAAPRERRPRSGDVLLLDEGGAVLHRLGPPRTAAYRDLPFKPTAVAHDEARRLLWVADGYGASLLHVYTYDGYLDTVDVTVAGVPLRGPHDVRLVEDRLLVADRGNHRVLALDGADAWSVIVPAGVTRYPGAISPWLPGRFVVAELAGRLTLFASDGAVLSRFGRLSGEPDDNAPWPNGLGPGVPPEIVPPTTVATELHTAHSIDAIGQGELVVSQWQMGGGVFRIRPFTTSDALG